MGWISDYGGQRSIEERCRDLEEALNTRPDAGKLWRKLEKFGRIVNSNALKFGPFLWY